MVAILCYEGTLDLEAKAPAPLTLVMLAMIPPTSSSTSPTTSLGDRSWLDGRFCAMLAS